MSKHTEGPWETTDGGYKHDTEADDDIVRWHSPVYAHLPYEDDCDDPGDTDRQAIATGAGRTIEEAQANAALIAAAPDLLEAARLGLRFANAYESLDMDQEEGYYDTDDDANRDKIKGAIAKAEPKAGSQ